MTTTIDSATKEEAIMSKETDQPLDEQELGWDASRRHKLTIGLRATPTERLMWLEEAIALAHASGALPRRNDDEAGRRESSP